MNDKPSTPRLAVLIDAENIAAKYLNQLFDAVDELGVTNLRRAYGDFSAPHAKSWRAALAKHAISPRQQFSHTKGKNAADILMVVEAMDLLHSGLFDGFVLGSSDSDFSSLAVRIREHGLSVFGFGNAATPPSYRKLCCKFVLARQVPAEPTIEASAASAFPAIKKALEQISGKDGWVKLNVLGKQVRQVNPAFDPKEFGSATLGKLLGKHAQIEIAGEGINLRARLKGH